VVGDCLVGNIRANMFSIGTGLLLFGLNKSFSIEARKLLWPIIVFKMSLFVSRALFNGCCSWSAFEELLNGVVLTGFDTGS